MRKACKPLFIGIGGGTGAGKTAVACKIIERVPEHTVFISIDNYYRDRSYLPPAERETINYDHPDAMEWELLKEHVSSLLKSCPVEMPLYDFKTHTRRQEIQNVKPNAILILEGIWALYDDELTRCMDIRIYVETDSDVRILRRLRRDIYERGRSLDSVVKQYLTSVKPMHESFVEPTKRKADINIPEGVNDVCIDLIKLKIEQYLRLRREWKAR